MQPSNSEFPASHLKRISWGRNRLFGHQESLLFSQKNVVKNKKSRQCPQCGRIVARVGSVSDSDAVSTLRTITSDVDSVASTGIKGLSVGDTVVAVHDTPPSAANGSERCHLDTSTNMARLDTSDLLSDTSSDEAVAAEGADGRRDEPR